MFLSRHEKLKEAKGMGVTVHRQNLDTAKNHDNIIHYDPIFLVLDMSVDCKTLTRRNQKERLKSSSPVFYCLSCFVFLTAKIF